MSCTLGKVGNPYFSVSLLVCVFFMSLSTCSAYVSQWSIWRLYQALLSDFFECLGMRLYVRICICVCMYTVYYQMCIDMYTYHFGRPFCSHTELWILHPLQVIAHSVQIPHIEIWEDQHQKKKKMVKLLKLDLLQVKGNSIAAVNMAVD